MSPRRRIVCSRQAAPSRGGGARGLSDHPIEIEKSSGYIS